MTTKALTSDISVITGLSISNTVFWIVLQVKMGFFWKCVIEIFSQITCYELFVFEFEYDLTIKWVFTLFASIFHVSQFRDVQTVLCTYFELCKPFHSTRVNFDFWPIPSLRQFFDFSDFEFSIFKFTWKEWRNLIYFNTLFLRWFRSINSKMIWNERNHSSL